MIFYILGSKGSHIRNIIKFSGSSVKIASVEEEEASGGSSSNPASAAAVPAAAGLAATAVAGQDAIAQRRVTIVGAPEAQWKAQYLIFQKLREEGFTPGNNEDIRLTIEIMVPSAQVFMTLKT